MCRLAVSSCNAAILLCVETDGQTDRQTDRRCTAAMLSVTADGTSGVSQRPFYTRFNRIKFAVSAVAI